MSLDQTSLSQSLLLFCGYKGIDCNSFQIESEKDAVETLRALEFQFPHPILFIGPVEGELQWVEGVLPSIALFENKKIEEILKTLEPYFQEIEEKVEDQFFVMGPTFSVVDCILAGDLIVLVEHLKIELPREISSYIVRVKNKCRVS